MTKNPSNTENYEHSGAFVRVGWSDSLNLALHVIVLDAVHEVIGSSMGMICGGKEGRINRGLGKLFSELVCASRGLFPPGAIYDPLGDPKSRG